MNEIFDHKEVEANENELKGICYTGISLLAFLIIVAGSIVYGAVQVVSLVL